MKAGALLASAAGGLFVWSGLKGASVTGSLRSLVSGQQPSGDTTALLSAGDSSGSSGSVPAPGGASGSAKANQATARLLAAPYGWSSGQQWAALVALWNKESTWNNKAKNPTSGAYGIAQALPPTKYPLAGQEAGGSHAAAQISWGLAYIKSRYGNPVNAWQHEQANNWY